MTPATSIMFPPFQIDLAAGRLRRGRDAIGLPPKAFGVLQYLAERAGRLISKEELLGAMWPNVHVGEAVLKVTIAEIRKALADCSQEPKFIETAHRRGYRFIAETESAPCDRHAEASDMLATVLVASPTPMEVAPQPNPEISRHLQDQLKRSVEWFKGREYTLGRGSLMASFDGATRAIRCASSCMRQARSLGFEMQAGLHVGECHRSNERIVGFVVEVARGIAEHACPGEILVSATVRDLVTGSDIQFRDRGFLSLPGGETLGILNVNSKGFLME